MPTKNSLCLFRQTKFFILRRKKGLVFETQNQRPCQTLPHIKTTAERTVRTDMHLRPFLRKKKDTQGAQALFNSSAKKFYVGILLI